MTAHHFTIADLHLGHANVLKHDNRPFASIEEHDAALTASCAELGSSNRTLWLLGDVATRKKDLEAFMSVVAPRWGKIILIRGNHDDKVAWRFRDMFTEAHEARYLRISPAERFYLSHYAHRTWRNSHHGAYHLHGHSHGALPPLGRSMDVGANCIGYAPISLQTAVERMHDQPNTNHH